jgi:hypothetical protein
MDARRAVQAKQQEIERAGMEGKIELEQRNRELVTLVTENARADADAKAYGIAAAMKAFEGVDATLVQALAMNGMQPDQIVATAFRSLAENARHIGELNIQPDLLRDLINRKAA